MSIISQKYLKPQKRLTDLAGNVFMTIPSKHSIYLSVQMFAPTFYYPMYDSETSCSTSKITETFNYKMAWL